MTQELELNFTGSGEVKGYNFTQLDSTENGYLYQVNKNGKNHYEVFERKETPVCLDFEKRIYSETDLKVRYPKSSVFGIWAWTYNKLEIAKDKLRSLNN